MADTKQVSNNINIASKMDDEAVNGDPPAPRENMIATAVRFLQNPKVRESPFPQRKTFLSKKGLTEKEIEIAIERSGTAADATSVVSTSPNPGVSTVVPMPPPAPSTWSRVRDYSASIIVIGGASYGLYNFLMKYVMPRVVGPSEEDKRTEALNSSIKELEDSVRTMVDNLKEMQKTMKAQEDILKQTVYNSASLRGPMEMEKMQQQQYVTEIKGEIQSLKGLLLSKKQFPPTPKTTPVIPAWQLGGTSKSVLDSSTKVSEAKATMSDVQSDPTEITGDSQPEDHQQSTSEIVCGDIKQMTTDASKTEKTGEKSLMAEEGFLTEEKQEMEEEVGEVDNKIVNGITTSAAAAYTQES